MQATKKHFALLISLLFAISLSADPVIHSLETDDDHSIVECQVCESESFKAYDYYSLESYAALSKIFDGKKEIYNSSSIKGFSARAPPRF